MTKIATRYVAIVILFPDTSQIPAILVISFFSTNIISFQETERKKN